MEFLNVLKQRRTRKLFNGKSVSRDNLQELLTSAITAPCHRRNEPWNFTVVEQSQLANLITELEKVYPYAWPDKDEEFVAQKSKSLNERISKLGAMIYVGSRKDEKAIVEQENYAACACAVQNILLAATDLGISSFWCTGAAFRIPEAMRLFKHDPEKEQFVAAIWLGYSDQETSPPKYNLEASMSYWQ